MRRFSPLLLALLLAVSAVSGAQAVVQIDITRGVNEPLPIALPALAGTSGAESQLGADVMRVVSADLERSGLFAPINPRAFIEQITASTRFPRFPDWRQINAQALVTGVVTPAGGGRVTLTFRLWDVFAQQQISGKEFTTDMQNWRRVSHLIADEIYKRLTGEDGYFDSRIVYVAESGPAQKRIKRLAIMDQDGENHMFLTNGASLVLTPRFAPNKQEIIYMSYAGNTPKVHIRNLETGQDDVVGGRFDGMSFAPRFSPRGDKIAMSIASGGNTEIYVMNIRSRQRQRLTSHPGIDTSPSFSPDGGRIVFNSDRGGSQQLYIMGADGGGVQRISFGDGRYGTPVWSPRADLIAFTKMKSGTFYIGVMRPDGSGERLLTQGYLVEGPTWSPNGRVIAFTREGASRSGGRPRIFTIDITGFNERELVTPGDASDPAWSPLL
jgi:TolB protein